MLIASNIVCLSQVDILSKTVSDLVHGRKTWESMVEEYGLFLGQESTKWTLYKVKMSYGKLYNII